MNEYERTLQQMKNVDLFATLSERTLKRIIDAGRSVTHPAGKVIVSEGDGSIGFHLVVAGSALVDVAGATRTSLGLGDYFGEIALLDGKPRTATVTANSGGVDTLFIRSVDFLELLEKHPEMYKPIVAVLCRRIRDERGQSA